MKRSALSLLGHYLVLCAIGLICIFPFWWTFVTAISTEGNIFAFPPTFWPKAPAFDNFVDRKSVV